MVSSKEFNSEVETRLAETEWAQDAQGYDFLDYERFTMANFRLAERYRSSRTAEDYARFLQKVYKQVIHNSHGKQAKQMTP